MPCGSVGLGGGSLSKFGRLGARWIARSAVNETRSREARSTGFAATSACPVRDRLRALVREGLPNETVKIVRPGKGIQRRWVLRDVRVSASRSGVTSD